MTAEIFCAIMTQLSFDFADAPVNVFVLYNHGWKLISNTGGWIYDGGGRTVLTVRKGLSYTEHVDKLYKAISVNRHIFDLKIEVIYPCGGHPFTAIQDWK